MAGFWLNLLPILVVAAVAPGTAQETPRGDAERQQEQQTERSGNGETLKKASDIAAQPARDVGAVETKIPPILVRAAEAPYTMDGVGTCTAIASEVASLNEALGPDFTEVKPSQSTEGKIAETGGRVVVNSIIPFRGLVREISGAASAERKLQQAADAGFARRGFLRGIHKTRGCKNQI